MKNWIAAVLVTVVGCSDGGTTPRDASTGGAVGSGGAPAAGHPGGGDAGAAIHSGGTGGSLVSTGGRAGGGAAGAAGAGGTGSAAGASGAPGWAGGASGAAGAASSGGGAAGGPPRCPTGSTECPCDVSALCPAGYACVDETSDEANCGACGRVCPGQATCTAGACKCQPGYAICGTPGACVDATTDTNCGACGHACAAGSTCGEGVIGLGTGCVPVCDGADAGCTIYLTGGTSEHCSSAYSSPAAASDWICVSGKPMHRNHATIAGATSCTCGP
jgi:hypothetical protein